MPRRTVKPLLAAASLPSSEEIRRIAGEVAARPHFDLDRPVRDDGEPFWLRFFGWLIKPFEALFRYLEGLPDVVRWVIVALAVLACAALIAHLAQLLIAAVRGPGPSARQQRAAPEAKADPATLERTAESRSAAGDHIGALRLLLKAAIRRIELAEEKPLRPGITNRQLLRRYQATRLAEPLRWFVEAIDRKWYGGEPCDPTDYAAGRRHHAEICSYVGDRRRAVGA